MSTLHFVDVDGTICDGGSDELYPGVVEQVRAWKARGDQVVYFTCRHIHGPASGRNDGSWLAELHRQGMPPLDGWIHKPLADHYTWWDDKILAAGHQLGVPDYPLPEKGLWFSRNEIHDVLGEDAVQKLVKSRK